MFALRPATNVLPVEMLAYIFAWWAYIDADGPWMAASVCKHWRRIVLGCPAAWGNIMYVLKVTKPRVRDDEWCIEEDDLEELESPRDIRRPLDLWARRSKGLGFSLNIFIEQKYPQLPIRLFEDFRVLQDHFPHMRQLSISSEDGDVTSSILGMLSFFERREATKPIQLSNLHLTARGDRLLARTGHAIPRDDVVTDFWDSIETPHSLTFEGCQPPVDRFFSTKFDPARLRHLTLCFIYASGTHLARTLAHFQNLKTLELRQIWPPRWQRAEPLPDLVTLPKLTQLTVARVTNQVCIDLLSYLRTPYLAHFSLQTGGFDDLQWELKRGSSPYEAMSDLGNAVVLFAQSAPRVKTFQLAKTAVHDKHILAVLVSWHSIRELSFADLLVGSPLVRGLTPDMATAKSPTPLLCPNLQVLRVEKCDLLPGGRLVSLAQARNASKSFTMPLTSLDVLRCEKVSSVHVARIRMTGSTCLHVL